MIIPLGKLLAFDGNKYIFSRAAMDTINKLGNIKDYPEDEVGLKIVPNILDMMLNENIKYAIEKDE